MSYLIDPRKNWALAEKRLADETDPRRCQILQTLIAHAKAEALPDFKALMATVSPRAHYRSYASAGDPEIAAANSPQGKDGVAAYYQGIVGSGCNRIEHASDRMAVGQDTLTTEGPMKMAYPGNVLETMGILVPDTDALYLYEQRLLIVWEFDEDALVLCEDSYSGGGAAFEGIADRQITLDEIYQVTAAD